MGLRVAATMTASGMGVPRSIGRAPTLAPVPRTTPILGSVQVEIGPVASASVTAWVTYARKALDDVLTEPGGDGIWLPDDTVATFRRYLDSWEEAATREDPLRWRAEVPADEAEYLSHAFFRIASHLAALAEARGYTMAPPEGDAFYRALVRSFLDALDDEGQSSQEFSEHLRSFWPGLEEE